ncbi:hypothetical protein LILAB_05280 [Corallococcus macrosporus]|uniref:Lipoprotein n=1 Tax=Myxococcus fulvus (strain ATCC BAA-855 / HW-1) TaxID=483219 RepID=F8CPV4_MYXFH|nr:hypothetical protein LILAB_05280 [Corallococcus macrosporus]
MSGVAAALAFVAVPGKAFAQPSPDLTLVECSQGNQRQDYAPAISLFARFTTVTGTGQLSSCRAPSDPGLAFGSFTIIGASSASCLVSSLSTQNTVTWNDGSESTIDFIGGVDVRPPGTTMVTVLGRVSGGRYEGALAIKTMDVSAIPGVTRCLLSGVRSANANISLTLRRLF